VSAPPAGASKRNGATRYVEHAFPVVGAHWTRGFIGEFGAPRSGGRSHEGFDVVAPCGAGLVSVRSGRVFRRGHDPVLMGHYLVIAGAGERRTYLYAHLARPPAVSRGELVWAGRRIGVVGATGNARTVGCHLHIEIRSRGRLIDPEPVLRGWDGRG
jgi:murein DD-endopeptidase MepM/ murein hydrolase activator NlpD